MTLKLKKIIYFMIIALCLSNVLVEMIGIPKAILYLYDLCNVIILFLIIYTKKINVIFLKNKRTTILIILAFLIYTFINFIINQQSFLLYIWGLRNNFRYFIFFIGCVIYLYDEDVIKLLNILEKLYVIHFLLYLYQFFIMHRSNDFVGGLFGINQGCNGGSNIFICIVITWSLIKYFDNKYKTSKIIFMISTACIMAVFSEIKIFFIELIVIIILIVLLKKKLKKNITIILLGIIFIIVSNSLLILTYGTTYQGFDMITNAFMSKGYSLYDNNSGLYRYLSITTLNQLFFQNKLFSWIGIGLGAADRSGVSSALISTFYQQNSSIHYDRFSNAFMYIETGYIGLFLYYSYFISVIVTAYKNLKTAANVNLNDIAIIIGFISLILILYNSSLRMEAGYLIYFVLAIPFVNCKIKHNNLNEGGQ